MSFSAVLLRFHGDACVVCASLTERCFDHSPVPVPTAVAGRGEEENTQQQQQQQQQHTAVWERLGCQMVMAAARLEELGGLAAEGIFRVSAGAT